MNSRFIQATIRTLGLCLILVGFIFLPIILGCELRIAFCYFYSDRRDYAFSQLLCHLIDWDFRIDIPIYFVIGLAAGIIQVFRLSKYSTKDLLRRISLLWGTIAVIVILKFIFAAFGFDYSN